MLTKKTRIKKKKKKEKVIEKENHNPLSSFGKIQSSLPTLPPSAPTDAPPPIEEKTTETFDVTDPTLLEIIESVKTKKDLHPLSLEQAMRRIASGQYKNKSTADLKKIFAARVNINSQDKKQGRSALHWAVIKKQGAAVDTLLEANASYDIPDGEGNTALAYAVDPSADPKIRMVLLTKFAADKMAKVAPRFKPPTKTETKPSSDDIARRKLIKLKATHWEKMFEFLNICRTYGQPLKYDYPIQKTKHDQAMLHFYKRFYSYYLINFSKEAMHQCSEKFNFCGEATCALLAELLLDPLVHSGKIVVNLLTMENHEGNHLVLLLDGFSEFINTPTNDVQDRSPPFSTLPDTVVLCNAMKGATHSGKEAAIAYLVGQTIHPSNIERYFTLTIVNAFNVKDLLYCQTEISNFLLGLHQAFLKEVASDTYVGTIIEFLHKTVYTARDTYSKDAFMCAFMKTCKGASQDFLSFIKNLMSTSPTQKFNKIHPTRPAPTPSVESYRK